MPGSTWDAFNRPLPEKLSDSERVEQWRRKAQFWRNQYKELQVERDRYKGLVKEAH